MSLKVCYNPKTGEIIKGETRHGNMIKKDYDKWVRAIYFETENYIYFRFYDPNGEYQNLTDDDRQKSFDVCEAALNDFRKAKLIKKNVKVLFWTINEKISAWDIKY